MIDCGNIRKATPVLRLILGDCKFELRQFYCCDVFFPQYRFEPLREHRKTNIYETLMLTPPYGVETLVISQLNLSLRKLTVSTPCLKFIGEISLAKETFLRLSFFSTNEVILWLAGHRLWDGLHFCEVTIDRWELRAQQKIHITKKCLLKTFNSLILFCKNALFNQEINLCFIL